MQLSKRAKILKPSPTLALAAKAKELLDRGQDVVSLTVGEPDWDTFPRIADAGKRAIDQGFTKYTQAAGTPELRRAIAEKTNQQLGTKYEAHQVVVGAGAKFVLFAALQLLLDEGDEVVIPAPYWVSYPMMAELSGANVKSFKCRPENNFQPTAAEISSVVTAKTKVLILCSPSNPTGMIIEPEELKKIAALVKKNPQICVITDDIYNSLCFNKEGFAPHILQVAPDLVDQVLVVNGASKTYAMTGWRAGWGLGPANLMKALADYISQSTSNICSISQAATLVAIKECDADVWHSRQELKKKLDWCLDKMTDLKLLKALRPQGAFYIWLDVRAVFGKKIEGKMVSSSKEVSEILLDKYLLATVPGEEFGYEGYLRLSYAASYQQLEKAIYRLHQFGNSVQS